MWPTFYYNNNLDDENNKMRCIMKDKTLRDPYFKAMSHAMALKCDVFARVMSAQTLAKVPKTGIFYNTEYASVRATAEERKQSNTWLDSDYDKQIQQLEYIKAPDGGDAEIYWKRGMTNPPRKREETHEDVLPAIEDRDNCGAQAGAAAIFDAGGALPVDW